MVKKMTLVGDVCLPSEGMIILTFRPKKVPPQFDFVTIIERRHVMCTLFPEQLTGLIPQKWD